MRGKTIRRPPLKHYIPHHLQKGLDIFCFTLEEKANLQVYIIQHLQVLEQWYMYTVIN